MLRICPFYREENEIVPLVVKSILSMPPTAHLAIRYTSIKLFGELCEWTEKHAEYLGKWSSWTGKKTSIFYEMDRNTLRVSEYLGKWSEKKPRILKFWLKTPNI